MSDSAVDHSYQLAKADFDRIRRLIYERAGISLHEGKQAMVYSRLTRRLRELRARLETDGRQYDVRGNGIAVVQRHLIAVRCPLDAFPGAAEVPVHPDRDQAVSETPAGFADRWEGSGSVITGMGAALRERW